MFDQLCILHKILNAFTKYNLSFILVFTSYTKYNNDLRENNRTL